MQLSRMGASSVNCSWGGCGQHAVVHLLSAKQYRCIDEQHLCERHGREFMAEYHAVAYPAGLRSADDSALVQLDVELLAIYEGSNEQGIYLRDVNGSERFFMLIGTVEAWALCYCLKHETSLRPMTHQTLSNTIAALGGRVKDALLDEFSESPRCYHAKLRIEVAGKTVAVDVRPSDAFCVATLNAVPILILGHVMRSSRKGG